MSDIDNYPCPFCREAVWYVDSEYQGQWCVVCDECGAQGPMEETQDAAIEAWCEATYEPVNGEDD